MNEKIKEIQQWLWDHKFAPKNVSYEKFVDGYDGRMTQAALRKAKENHWEFKDNKPTFTMSWQKPSEKPKPENILAQRLNLYTTIAKQKEKERLAKEQEDAKKYGSSMKGNARRFTKQLLEDLVSKQYDIGIYGADGRMGNDTKRALAQAEKDGWQVVNNRLVRRPEPESEKTVSFNPSTSPSVIGLPLNYGFPSSKKETLDNGIAHLTNKNLSEKEILDAKLQYQLYKNSFYGDVPLEEAVDGKFGRNSKAALQKALNNGYTINEKGVLVEPDPSKIVKTGKAFYISYPEHKISTSGTGLEGVFGTHLPTPISGHAASIIVDDEGNATYHYYGRYGDNGSYHTKTLPKWKQEISEEDYLKSIRPHLEYTNNNEPVTAVYIPEVDATKARNYYRERPNTGKYNLFNGTTCAGEACAGIDAGRGESSSTWFDNLIPDTPENVRRNYSRMSGTKTIDF